MIFVSRTRMSPWSRDGVDAEVSLIVYEEDYVDDHDDRASYRVAEDFGVLQELPSSK